MLKNKLNYQFPTYFIILLFILISTGCNTKNQKNREQQNNTLTSKEKKDGWKLLFDGKTFNGWRGLGTDAVPDGWIIEDGAIKILPKTDWPRQADGQPILGADLITVDTYEDFELSWEWKLNKGGNSGIKYNVSEELSIAYPPKGCALGFEFQMMDDSGLSGSAKKDNSTGCLYDIVPPDKNKIVKPLGEYNTSKIKIKGNRGEHWLNGSKVLEYELGSPQFDALIQQSKFKDIPGFASKRKGHIVLQDHAEEAWFRNIKIKL